MTNEDLRFVGELLSQERFTDPVLELGAGYGGRTCREAVESTGRRYVATDLKVGPGVDYAANVETGAGVEGVKAGGPFGLILVLNVLEHTFDPIAVLDNAIGLLSSGGYLVALTPAVWPLHGWPLDCCRLLPDWYREFGKRRGLTLDRGSLVYVGVGVVEEFRDGAGHEMFPPAGSLRPLQRAYSRAIHRAFNTYGRGMAQSSHLAIAAVFQSSRSVNTDRVLR